MNRRKFLELSAIMPTYMESKATKILLDEAETYKLEPKSKYLIVLDPCGWSKDSASTFSKYVHKSGIDACIMYGNHRSIRIFKMD